MSLFLANLGLMQPPTAGTPPSGITFVAAGSIASNAASGDTTPTPPTHQADDILIAVAQNQNNVAMSTATSGWTQFASGNSGGIRATAWWKRASGAGTAGPQITASAGHQHSIVYAFRGCVTSGDPVEDGTETGASGNTPTTSVITTTGPDRLAVCFEAHMGNVDFTSNFPPSGWDAEDSKKTATGLGAGFNVISIAQASAGNVSAANVGTFSASQFWETLTVALIPA